MKKAPLQVLAILCALGISACSGGGAGGGTGPGVHPTPPSTPITTFAFHIIGPHSSRSIAAAPTGSTINLPSGYSYGGPVANAIVTYPDGSSQQADGNGIFTPFGSSYASKYPATLGIRAVAQPVIKLADPQGGSTAGIGIVTPFASSPGATVTLGGVTALPEVAQLFPGELMTLVAVGTGTDDNITGLGSAQIAWSSANGATITPIPGTNQATYLAPPVAGGTQNDIVTATVHVPGNALAYTATSSITTIAPSNAFSVSGVLTASSGATISSGSAFFVAEDAPRAYPSFNFAALADSTGTYQRYLPANSDFTLAISIPSAPQSVFPAILLPGGEPDFTTGAAGSSGTGNLQIGSPSEFDDAKDDAKNAIPDPIVTTRDGWLAQELTRIYPFWADSGVVHLLSASHVDGAPPAPVGSGLLAQWCYQWQARTGGDVLVLIENAAATCTLPGNDAFEIAPQSPSSFTLVQYRHLTGPYALLGPLNDSAGALLVAAGTWSQNVTMSGGAIASDTANVTLQLYGPVSQTLGAPVSQLTMQYSYSSSGGAPTVTLANVALSDPATGLTLATASGSLSQVAPASSCVGTASACYTASVGVTRNYMLATGSATRSFSMQDTLNGDGSATHTVTSLAPGDSSHVIFPIASATVRASGSCIVCTTNAGSLLDVDGVSQLGAFTLSAMQVAALNLLDTVEGGPPGAPVASLAFPL